jgi:hypothetical protein
MEIKFRDTSPLVCETPPKAMALVVLLAVGVFGRCEPAFFTI